MYGTIQIVPKYVSSITIANVSIKPFKDHAYSPDSVEINVPLDTKVKNEQIEFTVELMDSSGKLIYGSDAPAIGNNIALRPLRAIAIADPI